MSPKEVLRAAWRLAADVRRIGDGMIHDTYLVQGEGDPLVLQRVNTRVFRDTDLLMENVARVSAHLCAKQRDWAPTLVPTANGGPFAGIDGEVWRLWTWLAGAGALTAVKNDRQAHVAGTAFGRTYRWLQDLTGPRLEDSIPGFLQLGHYLD